MGVYSYGHNFTPFLIHDSQTAGANATWTCLPSAQKPSRRTPLKSSQFLPKIFAKTKNLPSDAVSLSSLRSLASSSSSSSFRRLLFPRRSLHRRLPIPQSRSDIAYRGANPSAAAELRGQLGDSSDDNMCGSGTEASEAEAPPHASSEEDED
eukprot:scaffold3559_cov160-Isochrysis_galbana.AAC.1